MVHDGKAPVDGAASRPVAVEVRPDSGPAELRERPQWVCWRYEWRPDKKDKSKGKWTKPPLLPRPGNYASPTDPSTWGTFEEALAWHRAHSSQTDGIGYVFS